MHSDVLYSIDAAALDTVRDLIARGAAADPRRMDLLIACERGDTGIISALLAAGANVDHATDDAATPLLVACGEGHAEAAAILLAAGAAVDHATDDGFTPLYMACQEGHPGVVSVLLAAGAAVDSKMHRDWTALRVACFHGHLACVKVLSSYGASWSIVDLAFATAAGAGHNDVCTWLIMSREWTSPLHHLEIISAGRARDLLSADADLEAAAREGGPTPLNLARALAEAGRAGAGSAAELVLRAAEPWSPEAHALFPAAARARAVELLKLGVLLSWQPRFGGVEGALVDVWLEGVIPGAVDRLCR